MANWSHKLRIQDYLLPMGSTSAYAVTPATTALSRALGLAQKRLEVSHICNIALILFLIIFPSEEPSIWLHKLITTGQHLGRVLEFNLSDDCLVASAICPTSGRDSWEDYRKHQAFFVYPNLPHIELVLRITQGSYQKKFKFLFKNGIDIETFLNTLRDYLKKHQVIHTSSNTEHDHRCMQTGPMFKAIELNPDQRELDGGCLHGTLLLKDSQKCNHSGINFDRKFLALELCDHPVDAREYQVRARRYHHQ